MKTNQIGRMELKTASLILKARSAVSPFEMPTAPQHDAAG
jgi:hypothetical protein